MRHNNFHLDMILWLSGPLSWKKAYVNHTRKTLTNKWISDIIDQFTLLVRPETLLLLLCKEKHVKCQNQNANTHSAISLFPNTKLQPWTGATLIWGQCISDVHLRKIRNVAVKLSKSWKYQKNFTLNTDKFNFWILRPDTDIHYLKHFR